MSDKLGLNPTLNSWNLQESNWCGIHDVCIVWRQTLVVIREVDQSDAIEENATEKEQRNTGIAIV